MRRVKLILFRRLITKWRVFNGKPQSVPGFYWMFTSFYSQTWAYFKTQKFSNNARDDFEFELTNEKIMCSTYEFHQLLASFRTLSTYLDRWNVKKYYKDLQRNKLPNLNNADASIASQIQIKTMRKESRRCSENFLNKN